ncbi:iron-containing alcohol dehydrogenase [Sphingomonas canadensis]|uniref:Iron-containing alcohol dehydrogenase n=1 Tax=Sphingomonas canadensis TaxID=1219257 RepID=A0ABW3H909_9SPHN|nr:iron-containing alcohol dehydrogenase [Sphingomonas canadensis]MCW3835636.1 iron-containing alcohol dehydrogenase [Sphingomonas canadensis]
MPELETTISLQQVGRLAFGAGVMDQVAHDLARAGLTSVCIVTTPPTRGHAERLALDIRREGGRVVIWDDCLQEPARRDLDNVLAIARHAGVDAVIGLGGGSAMDLAKLVAALLDGTQDIEEISGVDRLKGRSAWLACIPTTAGTGSEVSPIAIVLDEDALLKKGVVSPHLVPDAAYVDPLLMLSMPPAVTASTGLDALTHCIEAFANRYAHPMIDTLAIEGIRLIAASLLDAVRDGEDLDARTAMARGSLYGGLCLGPVNTAAVHALAYPLGGEFHIAHGISNALLLPHVLAFNLPAATERYALVAEALGCDPAGSREAVARRGLDRVRRLSEDCGIPLKLSLHGVTRDSIPRMADGAMTVTRLLERNVREVHREDAIRIYEEAY